MIKPSWPSHLVVVLACSGLMNLEREKMLVSETWVEYSVQITPYASQK